MQRMIQFALTGTLLLLLTHPPLAAQDWKGRGRIQGQVLDPENQPVQGAQVFLRFDGLEEAGPEPLVTDKKGRWAFLGLATGSWTIQIVAENYMVSEGTVRVNEFGPPASPIRISLKPPAADPEAGQLAKHIEEGNEFLQAGEYTQARSAYEKALPDVPASSRPSLLRALAQACDGGGDTGRAIELLQEARTLDPEDTLTLKLLINVLLEAGRDEEAKPLIASLPSEEKLDLPTRLNLGIDLYNKSEMADALEHFTQAIGDYPEEPEPYYYRAMVHMGSEKNAEAAADFEKYLALAPADAPFVQDVKQFLTYVTGQ